MMFNPIKHHQNNLIFIDNCKQFITIRFIKNLPKVISYSLDLLNIIDFNNLLTVIKKN